MSIREQVNLLDRPTRENLKAELDRFWKESLPYAKAHRARFRSVEERDWSKVRLDDSETIDRAVPESLGRLVDSWGWRYQGGAWGASSNGWIFPATIDHREIDFHRSVMDAKKRWKSFDLIGNIQLSKAIDVEGWISSHQESLAPMEMFPDGSTKVGVRQAIDLESGKTLGELRQAIQTFADRIVALEKSAA